MGQSIPFDTLSYAKRLKSVGFTEEQAEAQAEALGNIVNEQLVSREFLDMRLKELEYRITFRLGSMMAASIAIVAALVKLL